jgi:hypothetical protein
MRKIDSGVPAFGEPYACFRLDEVTVNDQAIRISGSKDMTARCASGEADIAIPAVLSLDPEWRARKDSNL